MRSESGPQGGGIPWSSQSRAAPLPDKMVRARARSGKTMQRCAPCVFSNSVESKSPQENRSTSHSRTADSLNIFCVRNALAVVHQLQSNGQTHNVICKPRLLQGRADDCNTDDRLTYALMIDEAIPPWIEGTMQVQLMGHWMPDQQAPCTMRATTCKMHHSNKDGVRAWCRRPPAALGLRLSKLLNEQAIQGLFLVGLLKDPPKACTPVI